MAAYTVGELLIYFQQNTKLGIKNNVIYFSTFFSGSFLEYSIAILEGGGSQ